MGSMAGTFTIPEFNSSYTITDSNLVRIGDKKFLEKNLPGFFRFRDFWQKTKKSIFSAPTAKNGFNGRNFYYT
jgi:hypothetical protein